MNVVAATAAYERWLAQRLRVIIKPDLERKHRAMSEDPFSFLRATFYRWAQVWPQQCAHLTAAPKVLGVGDLHVENFGTWRDGEGRLIWGINDFDEATTLPYTNDLVRLCTSALIAISEARLDTPAPRACESVLEGYTKALLKGGDPVVLAERNRWLRDLAMGRLKEQRAFWDTLLALPTVRATKQVEGLLKHAMPHKKLPFRIAHRQAGLGSLGRQRFTALAKNWRGGAIAREAKPLTTSGWWWFQGKSPPIEYSRIRSRAVRVEDPFLQLHKDWIVRRLAPDCSRIEMKHLAGVQDECRLLWMMGWETGNVHLGSRRQVAAIQRDLRKRKGNWLLKAARSMRNATIDDWNDWRNR